MLDENDLIDAVPKRSHRHMPVIRKSSRVSWDVKLYSALIVTGICGLGLWRVWDKLIYLGYFLMGLIGLMAIMGTIATYIWLRRFLHKPQMHVIPQTGLILYNQMDGKITTIAPQIPVSAKSTCESSVSKTSISIAIPRVTELLANGTIYPGQKQMLIGYHEDGTTRWGNWKDDIKTTAVGGRGRSGKTVTMFFYVLQAIFSGAIVWLVDPHAKKDSGLTKLLGPLTRYARVATTDEEIAELMNDLAAEVVDRRQEAGPHRPFVFVCDEWNGVLLNLDALAEERGEKDRGGKWAGGIVATIAREMAGFDMYAFLCVHSWTDREIGGALVRRLIHSVVCHRMATDYSKHILPSREWNSLTPNLRTGRAVFRDNEGNYDKLALPLGVTEDAYIAVQLLEQFIASQEEAELAVQGGPTMPELPPAAPKRIEAPQTPREQRAYGLGYQQQESRSTTTTGPLSVQPEQAMHQVQRQQQVASTPMPEELLDEEVSEEELADREGVPEVILTAAEESEFLQAAMQLLQETGKKPGRVAVMQRARQLALARQDQAGAMKWNKKNWARIMALGQKFGI